MITQRKRTSKGQNHSIKFFILILLLGGIAFLPYLTTHAQKTPVEPDLFIFEEIKRVDGNSEPTEVLVGAITNLVECSQSALAAAIDVANENPGPDTIQLNSECVYEIDDEDDDVDPVYRYNAFSPISSEITINGNGAMIKSLKLDIRTFQITPEGKLNLINVEIEDFDINVAGGSILNQGILHIDQSTFIDNKGREGGVLYNDGEALISNSTFTQNYACCCNTEPHISRGGAIYNNGTLRIVNSTFNNNQVNIDGKHIYNNEGDVTIENSILATTSPIYAWGDNCAGSVVIDGGGNLQWPNDDDSCVGVHGDPKLAPLADNGGLTRSFRLLSESAAIDNAVDSICSADPVNNTSQNGVTRPHGAQCDIGSFELDYLLVESITRVDPNPTNAESVSFEVTFSRSVTGVDMSDFTLTTTDIQDASVQSVSGSDDMYTVVVDTGSSSGTLRLDLVDDDSIQSEGNLLGMEGMGNGDFTSGEVYTIDKDPPVVTTITRKNGNPNRANYVAYLVTFTEPVVGVDATDFVLDAEGLSETLILSVIQDSEDAYTVNVSTGIGSGTLRLDLIDDDSVLDLAGNSLGGEGLENGDFMEGEVYTIDKIPPVVSSITIANENPSSAAQVDFIVAFSEIVTGVDLTDFTLTMIDLTGAEILDLSGTEMTYILTVDTGVGDGVLGINLIDDDSIKDLAGNPLGGEGLLNGDFTEGEDYTIIDSPIFADVPNDHWAYFWIEQLYEMGITKGCKTDPLSYCPDQEVTRAEMAVFLERGIHGSDFNPPLGTGTIFDDVLFDNAYVDWIENLYADGITAGCDGGNYCPDDPVTRAQMAIFLLRAKYDEGYEPSPIGDDETGFTDVAPDDFAAAWIKQLAEDEITAGCGDGKFCPDQAVTRAQMAVFLVRIFDLP
jgi:hypothetical protein